MKVFAFLLYPIPTLRVLRTYKNIQRSHYRSRPLCICVFQVKKITSCIPLLILHQFTYDFLLVVGVIVVFVVCIFAAVAVDLVSVFLLLWLLLILVLLLHMLLFLMMLSLFPILFVTKYGIRTV